MIFQRSAGFALAMLSVLGCEGADAAQWDFATVNAPTSYQSKLNERFAAEVSAATKGEVKITVHAGGQLGFKGPDMLGALRDGLVPIGSMLLSQQAGLSPLLGTSAVPYLVSGFDEAQTFRTVSKPYLDAEYARFNQKLLYIVPWPSQNVYSKAELATPDTLTTMKIRTPDRSGAEFFRTLGASPAQIPLGELVPALATGVIDSVSTSSSTAVDAQFWEFLKYCTVIKWQTLLEGVSVNLDSWNELSPENQKLVGEVAARLEPEFWQAAKAEDEKNFQTLVAKGLQVKEPSAEVRAFVTDKGKASWASFEEAVPSAKPLIDAYLAAVGK